MKNIRISASCLVAAVWVAGCASAPEPADKPATSPTAPPYAQRTDMNSPQMQRLREEQRRRNDADLACLDAAQRSEFDKRLGLEMTKGFDKPMLGAVMAAMDQQTRNTAAIAARSELAHCTSKLPADADWANACPNERAEVTKREKDAVLTTMRAGILEAIAKSSEVRAKVRAEFPACEVKK